MLRLNSGPSKAFRGKNLLPAIVAVLIVAGVLVVSAYQYGALTSCSGYPPAGNCRGNYSYTFTLTVGYSGPWTASYQGYRGEADNSTSGYYVSGSLAGTSSTTTVVALTGPNTGGLKLCAQAGKLDTSNSTLTLGIEPRSNATSQPGGVTTVCLEVVP